MDKNHSLRDHSLELAHKVAVKLEEGLSSVIKGKSSTIKLIITALIADGHVLLEDYPGSGKTTLSKALGKLISSPSSTESYILPFRRIQFTPDMLPGDVLGVNIFDSKSSSFKFIHGPVFAHIVLADEINRTGPKVQAAFLECMAEKQVTLDNNTYPLDALFFVIGTQNPLDIAGTYPLPLVQLDRFLFRLPMSYVDSSTELEILEQHSAITNNAHNLPAVCTRDDILAARLACEHVFIHTKIRQAIVAIIQSTRNNPALQFGASTRAAIMLQQALKSWALVNGRDVVSDDDLKYITPFVLAHRLKFIAGQEEDHAQINQIILPHIEALVASAWR